MLKHTMQNFGHKNMDTKAKNLIAMGMISIQRSKHERMVPCTMLVTRSGWKMMDMIVTRTPMPIWMSNSSMAAVSCA